MVHLYVSVVFYSDTDLSLMSCF